MISAGNTRQGFGDLWSHQDPERPGSSRVSMPYRTGIFYCSPRKVKEMKPALLRAVPARGCPLCPQRPVRRGLGWMIQRLWRRALKTTGSSTALTPRQAGSSSAALAGVRAGGRAAPRLIPEHPGASRSIPEHPGASRARRGPSPGAAAAEFWVLPGSKMTLWNGSYPFYPGANACFPFDATRAVIVSVFLSMLATFIVILPGIPGRGRLFWFLRSVLGLFMGAVILNVQFSRDWETGWVQANTSYKSFSRAQVNADIGLHIGLAGLNVTLRGNPVQQINETINYNEHFPWSFGADFERSYSEGLQKGLPSPILYVAEKFGRQSPCAVHGQYRVAGHYVSITLWLAFCTWLISVLLFSMSILLYGGQMLLLTATLILFSLLLFSTVRNTLRCPIQFGPVSLRTDYGESFWLALATGLLSLLLGLGIIILNSLRPEKLKLIFSLDKGSEEELWDKSCLPAQPSCSAQDGLMVPLGELCHGTTTQL
uniref:Dual oxidase maturation factor 1 n=1 Tax=Taeniopygia guttata TaxID=59729 RepID=H0Z343_TAEGU